MSSHYSLALFTIASPKHLSKYFTIASPTNLLDRVDSWIEIDVLLNAGVADLGAIQIPKESHTHPGAPETAAIPALDGKRNSSAFYDGTHDLSEVLGCDRVSDESESSLTDCAGQVTGKGDTVKP